MKYYHQCSNVNPIGTPAYFICNTCGFDGDLSQAIEHIIKNQYLVKDDNRNPVVEISQNFNKHAGQLSPVRVRQARY